MTNKKKFGVLISGRGSNLQALIDAAAAPDYPADIVLVISNRPGAAGLDKAAAAGLAVQTIDHKAYEGREAFEADVTAAFEEAGVHFICLAGFMRLLTAGFVERWANKIINIHPSLLPSFKGVDVHKRMIEAGVKLAGCTVHFVRPEMDDGPIIGQAAVPVLPSDDAETLAARILTAEHRLYPECVRLVASGAARLEGDVVVFDDGAPGAMLLNPDR